MKTAAIIGCGRPPQQGVQNHKVGWGVAHGHAEGYRQAFKDIELYAVDISEENLNAFGEKHNIPPHRRFTSTEKLYATAIPDAVSVCTWPALHVPQAREAMSKNVKAITVEKPLGLDGFQIMELVSAVEKSKSRVAVAHQRRYEPQYEKARQLIAEGVLGKKLAIDARIDNDWDVLSWTVHWFDMANYLLDASPQWMLAGVDHRGERRYGHAVENASVIMADYGKDRQGVFITGPVALPAFGISVRGERGLLQIGSSLKLFTDDGYREITCEYTGPGPYGALFTDLWASAHGGETSRCDISKTATATLMAYAAHESARTQKRVSFPLQTGFAPLEVLQHPPKPHHEPSHKIAVIADAHHEWPDVSMSGRDGLCEALKSLGHQVTLLDATVDLPPNPLADADVVVLYHTQHKTKPSHRAALEPWFTAGRPVVIAHCGIGAYPDWPEFRKWSGLYWVWGGENLPPSGHPHVPCDIRVDDPERFAVPWSEAWLPMDEMYQKLGPGSAIRTLATAVAPDGKEQVYAWQVIDHPNMVAWLPGHRSDMFTLDVVKDGLQASLRLALKKAKGR